MEPIQISRGGCAHCGDAASTSRREFLTAAAASAITALLVTACGGGGAGTDVTTVTGPVALTVQVSNCPALANVGGITRVDSGRTPIAVVRTGTDTFAAFSLICPHRGCTVDISGNGFQCPCHGARFASTGTWTGGQRTSNLQSLGTSYDSASGVVTITA